MLKNTIDHYRLWYTNYKIKQIIEILANLKRLMIFLKILPSKMPNVKFDDFFIIINPMINLQLLRHPHPRRRHLGKIKLIIIIINLLNVVVLILTVMVNLHPPPPNLTSLTNLL